MFILFFYVSLITTKRRDHKGTLVPLIQPNVFRISPSILLMKISRDCTLLLAEQSLHKKSIISSTILMRSVVHKLFNNCIVDSSQKAVIASFLNNLSIICSSKWFSMMLMQQLIHKTTRWHDLYVSFKFWRPRTAEEKSFRMLGVLSVNRG